MKFSKQLLSTGLASAIGLGALGGAIAANGDADNEKAAIAAAMKARVSFAEAIKTAETETGGKVMEAGIQVAGGMSAFYEVEIFNADGTAQEVQIDADTGKVIKVSTDGDEDEKADVEDNDENDEDGGDKQ